MKQLTPRTAVYLALDVVLLCICIWHIPYLLQRARLPIEADERSGVVVVIRILDAESAGDVRPGDAFPFVSRSTFFVNALADGGEDS